MIQLPRTDRRIHGLELTLQQLVALKQYSKKLARKKSSRKFNGAQPIVNYGRGLDFAEVRSYQTGDDIRSMDWRVTARTGKPHTKLFQEEHDQAIYLHLDLTSSMQFGTRVTFKSIIAAQVAALLAWKAVANNDRIGGFIFNDKTHYVTKPNASNSSILTFLKKIIELNTLIPSKTSHAEFALNHFANYASLLKHGNKLLFISDFYDFNEKHKSLFMRLAKMNSLHFIHIYDILENTAPPANYYSVTDGKQLYRFDSRSLDFQNRYQQQFNTHLKTLKHFCVQHKIQFTSIRTDADVINALQGIE